MRHTRILALTVPLVVMLAVNVSSIAAQGGQAPAAGEGSDRHPRVLRVVEHADSDTVVDVGAPGDSLGDTLAFGNPIFDADNTHEIGRDQGYCVRTNAGVAWECNWTVLLEHGSVVVEGPFYDDLRDSQLAITGGTGAFRSASGEMTLHARNTNGTAFDFVYSFTR